MKQNMTAQNARFAEFFAAYIVCALWSSHDDARPDGGDPLDANYDECDISPACYARMRADCAAFYADNFTALSAIQLPGYTAAQAGHDFWLTRNGHGAGFWDRGLGAQGEKLTESAKASGQCDLYVGDDRLIHMYCA